jgi:hypothetical protein
MWLSLLADFDAPWWIAGGWALDLFLDAETRPHGDVDVAVLRRDQLALHRRLRTRDLRYATAEDTLALWDGKPLALPVHGVWARRSLNPRAVDVRGTAQRAPRRPPGVPA